ncbi:YggS family pyridoxal phosphate-dependent enzyme [Pendulispora albinea]|uniref:Pyridoxal phosphate homeostasis protein n=1 Tax=Pendulispora albinea TaxID=2741071 RepID=A0ABZ2M4F8_9BACT
MSALAERLAGIQERIHAAARSAGRDPSSIRLVAVSKKMDAAKVREAYEAGQRLFGENYAQELAAKADALSDLPDIAWHFIGHLQSNKARLVAPRAKAVHTIDGIGLGRELARRAEAAGRAPLDVLIEVNVGGEPQKHGIVASELADLLAQLRELPSLSVRGLMTMPPEGDPEAARTVFETLASLRNLHGGPAVLPELSMGMSGDFELAIAAGATLVRVGSAIFGPRS